MSLKKLLYIILLLFITTTSFGLEIKGKIELTDQWQPKVFLALLNTPEDIFVASPDFIIAETFINPDGSFVINTHSVPDDERFYRLYLVQGDNASVQFSATQNKNYVHLLLNRQSAIELSATTRNNSLEITALNGSDDTKDIFEFDEKFQEQNSELSGQLPKAQSTFLSQELETFIHSVVADANNPYVGLYALYHIEDKETDFLRNSDFYFNFQKRLEAELPVTPYTEAYSELLDELVGFREFVCEMPGVQPKWKDWLMIIEAVIILVLLIILIGLYSRIKKIRGQENDPANNLKPLYEGLTLKQQEILGLLADGKTNKEIAQELFVELSTVKTHINNIYRQLNVSTRKEAVDFYRSMKN
ncbi:helix-turn-helix transcriptional regulator [Draconibacterium sp. IB214405]|uniref:helix-turn-helix domain-containing protein n=1 Tax=Draconibacterium sp. IB214405 TaxID=3097352 RepID=UPI002A161882|nr:helix-turn-helix transcriptional regulator [Draconibacterium sp. IB214405]MDX8341036.1 helix-turn-helix transcriptional regulator [Draconibacterium sp. IB214405]